jgi:hypothetical protein
MAKRRRKYVAEAPISVASVTHDEVCIRKHENVLTKLSMYEEDLDRLNELLHYAYFGGPVSFFGWDYDDYLAIAGQVSSLKKKIHALSHKLKL